jgi:hypothetical protein
MDRSRIKQQFKNKTMFIPKNIHELLDERIQFCESVLKNKSKMPASSQIDEMIERFDIEQKKFKRIREMLNMLTGESGDTDTTRQEFQLAASEMMDKLIKHCREQLNGVSDLLSIHQMLNLIDALNKISQQLYHL